jgi:hypothetical protein
MTAVFCENATDRNARTWENQLAPFDCLEFAISDGAKGIAKAVSQLAQTRREDPQAPALVVLHKYGRLWERPNTGLEMAIRRISRSDLLLMSGTSFPRLSNLGELDGPIGHPRERLHASTLGSRGDGDRRSP